MSNDLKIDPRVGQFFVQTVCRLLATFAILQGLNITFGGRNRWAGDSFAVALMLPGAPPTWGVILTLLGVSALAGSLTGRYTPVIVGMYGASIWSGFFAITFGLSAVSNPLASTTGVWAYGTFAVLFILVAHAFKESRKSR